MSYRQRHHTVRTWSQGTHSEDSWVVEGADGGGGGGLNGYSGMQLPRPLLATQKSPERQSCGALNEHCSTTQTEICTHNCGCGCHNEWVRTECMGMENWSNNKLPHLYIYTIHGCHPIP